MQEELERALSVVLRVPVSAVPLTVAGRTDAGVHAWGQVASYSGPVAPVSGLNGVLPKDVSVLSCAEAAEGFDARRDATSRAYCYRVLVRPERSALERGRALHWRYPVEFEALAACAEALVGVRDFTAFTPTETEHVRFSREVLAAYWRPSPSGSRSGGPSAGSASGSSSGSSFGSSFGSASGSSVLEFWIEADAFMRNMNRVLVGTMLEVARGRRSVADFVALLSPGHSRSEAGPTAPACGLYLAGVGYGGERVLTV